MSHLTKAQRYTIFAMHTQGFTNKKIAATIGKDKSTVGRELRRNCDKRRGGDLHTIASDNGKEFTEHKAIAKALGVDYYFAHPYHSWERGANENMNGLIRQYQPKGTSFDNLNDNVVRHIQDTLNSRPRKKLGYLSPIEYLFANFATELNLCLSQKVAFAT